MTKRSETFIYIIWIQTLLATGGSLYFSEVVGYVPCELCWIQRIFMYPLVIIYGAAIVKRDVKIAYTGLFFSGIGVIISMYHYLLQKFEALQGTGGFCGEVPCTLQYVNYFGFITIPFMAGIAFLVIFVLHIILVKEVK